MGNIVGNNPHKKIVDQIDIRQGALGLTQRPSDVLTWTANNTPWIRMCSTISISSDEAGKKRLKDLKLSENLTGKKLAQKFILGGGVYAASEDPKNNTLSQRKGVSNNQNTLTDFSYEFSDTFGLVPPPGIESVNIRTLTKGSIKKGSIKIRANSIEQFNIIETLFLRIGYYVFVEFGHSAYLNNDGKYISPDTFTEPFRKVLYGKPGEYSSFQILDDLKKTKEEFNGNYDGFLGKVTNFSWDFNPSGYYQISIEVFAMGDVAESFKINVPGKDKKIEKVAPTDFTLSVKNTNKLTNYLVKLKRKLKSSSFESVAPYQNAPKNILVSRTIEEYTIKKEKETAKSFCIKVPKQTSKKKVDFLYYTSLKNILLYLRTTLLLYDDKKDPLFEIDFSKDNYCYTHPYQLSSNPNVCLIPFILPDENLATKEPEKIGDFSGNSYWKDIITNDFRDVEGTDSKFVGNLLEIPINIDLAINLITGGVDEPEVTIYQFLSDLMGQVQLALGNVNKFDVTFNNEDHSLTITDDIPLADFIPNPPPEFSSPARFNIYGVKPGFLGSFVTNVGVKCTIPKSMATMVSVGAQVNGNSKKNNATAFSKWNDGLVDSLMTTKKDIEDVEDKPAQTSTDSSKAKEADPTKENDLFNSYLKSDVVTKFYQNITTLDTKQIESSLSNNSTFIKKIPGLLTQLRSKNTPNPNGFIPLTIDLDMMGLGGMKIYDRIFVTNDILPPNYKQNLAFIIKGISHNISNKGWTTKLDAYSYDTPSNVKFDEFAPNKYLEKNPR